MCQTEAKELVLFLEKAKKIQPVGTITFKETFLAEEKNDCIAHNCVLLLKIEFVTAERKKSNNKQKRFSQALPKHLTPFFVCDLWYDKVSKDFANYFHYLSLNAINFFQFFFFYPKKSLFFLLRCVNIFPFFYQKQLLVAIKHASVVFALERVDLSLIYR